MTNFLSSLPAYFQLSFVFKIIILIILFLYIVYTFLLLIQVKELGKIVLIKANQGSRILFFFSFIYLLLAISLFIAALVIL